MTTIRDLLNDLIAETIEKAETYAEKYGEVKLTGDDVEGLLDEYTEVIKEMIVG